MGDQVLEIIKKLGIFIILSQTIVHFCPNNSYERYIRMLVGIMIISLVVIPVVGIFFSQVEFDYANRLSQFEKEFYEAVDSVEFQEELDSTVTEEQVIKETEEKVKSKLNNAIQGINYNGADSEHADIYNSYMVNKVTISIIEDETYLRILIGTIDGNSNGINVEKIQVGISDNKNTGDIYNQEVIKTLKQFFAEQLEIKQDYLEVNWSE